MKILYTKILTLALLTSLSVSFFAGQSVFAQTATSTVVAPPAAVATSTDSADVQIQSTLDEAARLLADAPPPEPQATTTTPATTLDLQNASSTIQETSNAQPTLAANTLEKTADPNAAISELSLTPVASSSSSSTVTAPVKVLDGLPTASQAVVDASVPPVDVVAQNVEAAPVAPIAQVPEVIPAPVMPPTPTINIEEKKPDYSFALTGATIPAKRSVENEDGNVVGEETVAAPLTSSVDNTTGVVTVSGQCSDHYYVVLLFKNATDYANDRRSYIVNRAYPCVGNTFSYAISELPKTLQNGNYYLLVGEEGKSGTWKPITELTEITINKNK